MDRPQVDMQLMHKRVTRIGELLAEIGKQIQTALRLAMVVVPVFYDFFTLACLTAAVTLYLDGMHHDAVIWGIIGGALALTWVVAKLISLGVARFIRALQTEWNVASAEIMEIRRSGPRLPREVSRSVMSARVRTGGWPDVGIQTRLQHGHRRILPPLRGRPWRTPRALQ